jgi:hypothetical protein
MATQSINGRRVGNGRNSSTGTAVLEHPEESQTKNQLQEELLRVAFALEQGRLAERARTDMFEGADRTIM